MTLASFGVIWFHDYIASEETGASFVLMAIPILGE